MKGDTVKLVSVGTVTLATFVARAADGSTELVNPATGATITLTTKAEMKTLVRVKKAAVVPKVRVRSIPSWATAAASSTADVAVKPIALVTITKTKVDKWGYVNVASLSVSSLTFCGSPRSTYASIILNSLAIYLWRYVFHLVFSRYSRTETKTVAPKHVVPRLTAMPTVGSKVAVFWTPGDDVLRHATITKINAGGKTAKVAVPGTKGGAKVAFDWFSPDEYAGPAPGERAGPASLGETEAQALARVSAIPVGSPVIAWTPKATVYTAKPAQWFCGDIADVADPAAPYTDSATGASIFEANDAINGVVRVWQGDITHLAVDAIQNAANTGLKSGGGICGSIHKGAGPQLEEACFRYPELNSKSTFTAASAGAKTSGKNTVNSSSKSYGPMRCFEGDTRVTKGCVPRCLLTTFSFTSSSLFPTYSHMLGTGTHTLGGHTFTLTSLSLSLSLPVFTLTLTVCIDTTCTQRQCCIPSDPWVSSPTRCVPRIALHLIKPLVMVSRQSLSARSQRGSLGMMCERRRLWRWPRCVAGSKKERTRRS